MQIRPAHGLPDPMDRLRPVRAAVCGATLYRSLLLNPVPSSSPPGLQLVRLPIGSTQKSQRAVRVCGATLADLSARPTIATVAQRPQQQTDSVSVVGAVTWRYAALLPERCHQH